MRKQQCQFLKVAEHSQQLTIVTEHVLFTSTVNKHYSSFVDLTNMAGSDVVQLEVKVKIKSAGVTHSSCI